MRLPPFPIFPYSGNMPDFYRFEQSEEAVVAKICEWLCKLQTYVNSQTGNLNGIADDLEELQELFQEFQESGFADYYEDLLSKWIDEHMADILSESIAMVFFGLTSDGRFCAYIPSSWSQIAFDTGVVYGTEQYGRLILRYNAEGTGIIDNTDPNYPDN